MQGETCSTPNITIMLINGLAHAKPSYSVGNVAIYGKRGKMMKERTQLEWFENWMDKISMHDEGIIDLVFEYLNDEQMLTKEGKKLAHDFWEKHIKEDE